jgi:transposase, IS30 family
MHYSHLSLPEREEISRGMAQGLSLRLIASTLGRSHTTLSREVLRHTASIGYRACRAQFRAQKRARKPRTLRFTMLRPALWIEIQEMLHHRWSPEQISASLRKTYAASVMHVSTESIYAALYVLPRGTLRKELLSLLRRKHKKRKQRKTLLNDRRGQIADMVSIHDRPADVEDRAIAGHWEGDLILGRNAFIGTLVERTTRYLMLCKLSKRKTEEACTKFAKRFNTLPLELRQSMTYDRGKEMSGHQAFTKATKVKVYFCDPQSPWQRGTNENTNGLLRDFFPKGTDFSLITSKRLREVEKLMNDRPRKVLGWASPSEMFNSHLAGALGT